MRTGRKTGPPPQPTRLRILRGNPSKTRIPREEPQPAQGPTTAPGWLEPQAQELWAELAPELSRLGLLTRLDRQALASGCAWWAIYRRALLDLADGLVADTPNNGRQARPEVAIAQKAYTAATSVLCRFGITPSDRVRLAAPDGADKPKSKWEGLAT